MKGGGCCCCCYCWLWLPCCVLLIFLLHLQIKINSKVPLKSPSFVLITTGSTWICSWSVVGYSFGSSSAPLCPESVYKRSTKGGTTTVSYRMYRRTFNTEGIDHISLPPNLNYKQNANTWGGWWYWWCECVNENHVSVKEVVFSCAESNKQEEIAVRIRETNKSYAEQCDCHISSESSKRVISNDKVIISYSLLRISQFSYVLWLIKIHILVIHNYIELVKQQNISMTNYNRQIRFAQRVLLTLYNNKDPH